MSFSLRFSRPSENLVSQASAITIATGAALSGYGADRLNNADLSYPFKGNGASIDLVFEFAAPVLPALCAILNSNLTVAARLQGNASNSWGAPTVDLPFGIPTVNGRGFYSAPWIDASTATAQTWWRLHIASNGADVILGEFWMGATSRGCARSYLYEDAAPSAQASTNIVTTFGGTDLTFEQATSRDAHAGTIIASGSEVTTLRDLVESARYRARPFLLVPRSDVDDAWFVRYDLDSFSVKPLPTDPSDLSFRVPFPVKSVSRGLPWVDPDE